MNIHLYLPHQMRTRDINKETSIRKQAIEMIVKEGLDGFSMQKLAKAANVSPATLYIYYKDRDDLILNLSLEIAGKLMETSLQDFHPKMSFADGLAIQWKNRLDFFLKYPDDMEFIEHIRYTPVYEKVQEMMVNNFGEVMGKFVHTAINNGELAPLPFEVYWSVAFAPLYQLIKFHAQGRSYKSAHFVLTDELMQQTLQLVLKALRP
jgi:AcrR family transcriptional regulator